MNKRLLTGLIAAPFTPMHEDGSLNLQVMAVCRVSDAKEMCDGSVYLWHDGRIRFSDNRRTKGCCGKMDEAAKGKLKVIVHVGGMSQVQCAELAAHAQAIGADMIAAMAPCFFKPGSVVG